ncbi:MAG: S41 family peptidase [Alistipes putredinis]|nr:MAG: S41 family peptidase [Alistipes putredinis]
MSIRSITVPWSSRAYAACCPRLDPHSAYLTAEEVEDARESFDGSFGGIGVEFNILGDTIIVVSTIAGGPAESVGIRAGDRITGVDGRSAIGTKRADVPKLLRGPKGSRVKLEVVRKGASGVLDFEVVRGDIPISTVDAAYMAADGVGYIKVNRFGSNTVAEFTEAFERIGSPSALILDLRGNGGGLLDQAIGLSEFFLKKGEQIVSTEGYIVAPTVAYARRDGAFDGPLAILMDEASASGSEIVAGAVQDWDRGVIVGRPSLSARVWSSVSSCFWTARLSD